MKTRAAGAARTRQCLGVVRDPPREREKVRTSEFYLIFRDSLSRAALESSALCRHPGTWGPGGGPAKSRCLPCTSCASSGAGERPGREEPLRSGRDWRGWWGRQAGGTWAREAGVRAGDGGLGQTRPGRGAGPRGGCGGGGSRVRIRVPARPRLQAPPPPPRALPA